MLKVLDRYILKRFIGTYFFSNILIITIVIIFDISEKIENFVNAKMSEVIWDYYLNFIPYFLNMLSPMFTFIAVIFMTSRLSARYETVAILSSGISYLRFLRPYVIGATFIALLSLGVSHYVIPRANRTRQAFEDKYVNNHYQNKENNIHRQIAPGELIYLENYNNSDKRGFRFTLERIKNNKLEYMLSAESIVWDSIKSLWIVENYYERTINPESKSLLSSKVGDKSTYTEKLTHGVKKELSIKFNPADMHRIESKVEIMTFPELKQYIAEEKQKGSSGIERFEVENYKRTAVPFATYILTIIGVCLSSRKIRGGIGMHLTLGILLAASYMVMLHFASVFAINGMLSPIIAVWWPNLLYGIIAMLLYRVAQK